MSTLKAKKTSTQRKQDPSVLERARKEGRKRAAVRNANVSDDVWAQNILGSPATLQHLPSQTPVGSLLSNRNRGTRGFFVTKFRTLVGNRPVCFGMQHCDLLFFKPDKTIHCTSEYEVALCPLCVKQRPKDPSKWCRARHIGLAYQTFGSKHLGYPQNNKGTDNINTSFEKSDGKFDWVASHRSSKRKLVLVTEEIGAHTAPDTSKEWDPEYYFSAVQMLKDDWYVVTDATTVVLVESGAEVGLTGVGLYIPNVVDQTIGDNVGFHLRDVLSVPPPPGRKASFSTNLSRKHAFKSQPTKHQIQCMAGIKNDACNMKHNWENQSWDLYAGTRESLEYLKPMQQVSNIVARFFSELLPLSFQRLKTEMWAKVWNKNQVKKLLAHIKRENLPLDRPGIFTTVAPTDTYVPPLHFDSDDSLWVACAALKVAAPPHPNTAPPPHCTVCDNTTCNFTPYTPRMPEICMLRSAERAGFKVKY